MGVSHKPWRSQQRAESRERLTKVISNFGFCLLSGDVVPFDYDLAMRQLYGMTPPADPCERCQYDEDLEEEQKLIREEWAKEELLVRMRNRNKQ